MTVVVAGPTHATRWLLVDFHDSDTASTFGTYNTTWDEVIRYSANTAYVDPDSDPNHAGISDSGTSPGDNITYYGVSGTSPIDMQSPHRIVATFYNSSGSNKTFQARMSFKDANSAVGATWDAPWYQMYGGGVYASTGGITLSPYSTGELYLNIGDAAHMDAPLSPANNGNNYLVNISLTHFDTSVVLTKLELTNEQDTTAPTTPSNLQATAIAPSAESANCAVELTWTPSTDSGEGMHRYQVYRNDGSGWVLHEMVDKAWTSYFGSSTIVYRDYQVDPNTQYTYGIEAYDAEVNGAYVATGGDPNSHRGNVSGRATTTITTPSYSMSTLIDATSDITYLGKFRVPATGNWDNIGQGLAYNPNGNANYDPNSELPGSLYITGRPAEYTIGEFSIAKPVLTETISSMNQSTLLQSFAAPFNWTPSGGNAIWYFCGFHPGGNGVGPKVYGSQYRFYSGPLDEAHLCAFDLNLTNCYGPWHIGDSDAPDKVNFMYSGKFIFPVPQAWANTYVGGRSMFVGNGGHVSGHGMPTAGPSLYAVAPWENGSLPDPNGVVSTVELLRYGTHDDTLDTWHDNWSYLTRTMDACWAVSGSKQAVIVSGVIARGDTWYGGTDGSESSTSSYDLPQTISGSKGYNATTQEGSLMLFNPADLVRVAQSTMDPDEPRFYQTFNVQKNFLLNKNAASVGNVSIAFDQTNGYLYVHEADGETAGRSLMHVYQIDAGSGQPTNQAPTVDAGGNQTITLPATASLDGTVSDDDLPDPPASVTTTWTKVSGPGTVTFGSASAVDTTATFSVDGVYVLQLEGDDSDLTDTDTVTITVNPTPSGGDEIAYWMPNEGSGATAYDQADDASDGAITGATWVTGHDGGALQFDGSDDKVDGDFNPVLAIDDPMSVAVWVYSDVTPTVDAVFGVADDTAAAAMWIYSTGSVRKYGDNVLVSAANVPSANTWYHLCYTYDATTHKIYVDGTLEGSSTTVADVGDADVFRMGDRVRFGGRAFDGTLDDVRVYDRALSASEVSSLVSGAPSNAAPTVAAGADQTITLPSSASLDGTVSDDGLPDPPASVTTTWTKVSGPGTVTFGDASAVDTTASFSTDGTYVLELEADDSDLTASDTVTITVDPAAAATELAFWPLDGSTADASGNGNDGTASGGPTYVTGQVGQAMQFDGTDDEIDGSFVSTLSLTGPLTMAAWIKSDVTPTADTVISIAPTTGSAFTQVYSDGRVTGYGDRMLLGTQVGAPTGTWYHLCYTFDGTTNRIYLNGTEATNSTTAPDSGVVELFSIGNRVRFNSRNLDGAIDDVRIYDFVLSATQVDDLYNGTPPGGQTNVAPTADAGSDATITLPSSASLDGTVSDDDLPDPPASVTTTWTKISGPGTVTFGDASAVDTTASFSTDGTYVLQLEADDSDLTDTDTVTITVNPAEMVVHWTFNENSGSTANDASGNDNDGTISGATWTTGYLASALNFDNVDDQVDGSVAGGTISTTGSVSMSAWVYAPNGSDWSDAVVGLGGSGQVINMVANGSVRMYADATLVSSSVTPPTAQWYHLCYTYDGTTHRLYLDGVERGTGTQANNAATVNTIRVGNRVLYGGRPMDGKIDDVRIYDRTLSAAEVAALANE